MGMLTLSSTNPEFSFIIQKNPNTILESKKPFTKSVRKGAAYGWFTNTEATSFRLWFKDRVGDMSYGIDKKETFEYLDKTRYGSPLIPISLISLCLDSAHKVRDLKDVDGYTSTLETVVDDIRPGMVETLNRHLPEGVTLEYKQLVERTYVIRLTAPTVHLVLNHAFVIFLLLTFSTRNPYFSLEDNQAKKCIDSLNRVDAPYFIRYLFKIKVFHGDNSFNALKYYLDTPLCDFSFGDTQTQRIRAIKEVLGKNRAGTIHEIGFGEMQYTKFLMKDYEGVVGYEIDPDLYGEAEAKAKARGWDNVSFIPGITSEHIEENIASFENADILATEVFEHMPEEDASKILMALLKTDFKRIVLTLPNKAFNKHYLMGEDEMRHPDHYWEPTKDGAGAWVRECIDAVGNPGVEDYLTIQVGDLVEDPVTKEIESPTTLIVIERE